MTNEFLVVSSLCVTSLSVLFIHILCEVVSNTVTGEFKLKVSHYAIIANANAYDTANYD